MFTDLAAASRRYECQSGSLQPPPQAVLSFGCVIIQIALDQLIHVSW